MKNFYVPINFPHSFVIIYAVKIVLVEVFYPVFCFFVWKFLKIHFFVFGVILPFITNFIIWCVCRCLGHLAFLLDFSKKGCIIIL